MKALIAFFSLLFCGGVAAYAHKHGGHGHGGSFSAPEIDGPAGLAAMALIVSVGIVAYNRFIR